MRPRYTSALEPARRYPTASLLLHWSIAVLVAALLGLGWSMTRVAPGSELQFALYQLHKSLGISILVLSLARIAWRFAQPPPPLPRRMPRWERTTARVVQGAILVLTLAIPLLGWALVSTSRLAIPTVLFGVVPWPDMPGIAGLPLETRRLLEPRVAQAHALLAYALAALGLMHAGAALFHHLVRRDDVLWRMLPLPLLRRR